MDTHEARANLGLPPVFTAAELDAAFRRHASLAHPDRDGDVAHFHALVESRQVLITGARIGPVGRVTAVDNTPRMLKWSRHLRRRAGPSRRLL